jgi:hypothetical protein
MIWTLLGLWQVAAQCVSISGVLPPGTIDMKSHDGVMVNLASQLSAGKQQGRCCCFTCIWSGLPSFDPLVQTMAVFGQPYR